jgi:hypothetical protein
MLLGDSLLHGKHSVAVSPAAVMVGITLTAFGIQVPVVGTQTQLRHLLTYFLKKEASFQKIAPDIQVRQDSHSMQARLAHLVY